MDRRTFLRWIGLGWVSSSVAVAIAACSNVNENAIAPSPTPDTDDSSAARNDGFVEVGNLSKLDEAGQVFRQGIFGHSVLVVRDPTNAATLYAFEPVCTHQGCVVSWRSATEQIFCACHGSTFNPNGTVAKGPANQGLKAYEVKVESNSIFVKVN